MNINHEPVATRLMIDIKHQPDRVLVGRRLHPLPPVGGGLRPRIRAALLPLAPGWQGGLRPRATAARAPPAQGFLF